MIVVDDGSSDHTGEEIKSLISIYPRLRYIRHSVRTGQSAAIRTGVLAAQSPIIVTLDGDGQNDPADILTLMKRLGAPGPASLQEFAQTARQELAAHCKHLSSSPALPTLRI